MASYSTEVAVSSAAVLCVLVAVSLQYSTVAPYMDEIFHIPQAQRYCAGQLEEWDPKITTFPGLYLASMSAYSIARRLGLPHLVEISSSDALADVNGASVPGSMMGGEGSTAGLAPMCSAVFLRATNIFIAFAFYFMLRWCRHEVRPVVELRQDQQ